MSEQGSRFSSSPSGNRTRSASFKGSRRDYAPERVPCGSRTRLARLEAWSLCRSAKDTSCFKRKVRESNPQGREARPGSSGVPSPVGLTFRKAAEAGIEPASGRVTTVCPYQHEHHRIIHSVRMAGFEPAISCSRRTRNTRLSHTLKVLSVPPLEAETRAPSGSRTHTSAMARQ